MPEVINCTNCKRLIKQIKRQEWVTERVATLLISGDQSDYPRALAQAEFESTADDRQKATLQEKG